jgi:dTDP-4-dehydrorhamnose reductase
MRMLVTGAAGAVGSYVPDVFSEWELLLTDIVGDFEQLDVAEPEGVLQVVSRAEPDVVLHLAAATDVDRCEQDPDWAFRVNAIGTENVARATKAADAVLVYISTAGVFGGEKLEPYNEFDEPRPANVYGDSKLAGERLVTSLVDRFYIARAGWMVGGGHRDKKFVGKIVQQIEEGTTGLRAVDDKLGSPTYAPDLLEGIKRLLATGYHGLYHLVNDGACTRYDVAVAVCELLGRDDISVEPVSSAFFPLPAPRARSEAMRNYKLELLGLEPQRPWRDALSEYLQRELAPAAMPHRAVSQ